MESKQNNKFESLKNPHINSFISLKNINKVYPNGFHAIYDFNLEIKENEFIVFVGPSGCGKSTTLRMIAGLEDITAGDLYINQIYSNNLTPKDRDVAMVFQNYALYPHMSVYDNMAFGLKMRHYPKDVIDERVHTATEILDLSNLLDYKPRQLSGGQMQRVALGRTIVRNAKIFLMDEPLSNLDAKLRVTMRSEIIKLHRRLKTTSIYVTHDQAEAMTMADRIVVMNKGFIQQIGTPEEIFAHPVNRFVASFIGTPAMNIYEGHYDIDGTLHLGGGLTTKLSKQRQKIIKNFFNEQIDILKNRAKNIDFEVQLVPHQASKEEIQALKEERLNSSNEEFDNALKVHNIVSRAVIKGSNQFSFKTLFKRHKLPTFTEVKTSLLNDIQQKIDQYTDYLLNGFDVDIGMRPDYISLAKFSHEINAGPVIELTISVAELLGNEYYLHADFENIDFVSKIVALDKISIGDKVEIVFDMDKLHLFDKISGKAII